MSPKVQVIVNVVLPADKPCDKLSAAARSAIGESFCDNTIKAAGMDRSDVECKATITCGSRRQFPGRSLSQADSRASLEANLQVVTTSEAAINSNNKAASSIATAAKKKVTGIMKETLPGAKATVEEVSTEMGTKPPTGASSGSCSFSGTYTIRPLYAPCSKKYLSYKYKGKCKGKSKSITLLPSKKVRRGRTSLKWDLDGTESVPIVGSELSSCKYNAMSAPSKPGKKMKLGSRPTGWKVVPRKAGDCSKVNLYSSKRKGYLALDTKCRTFYYATKPNSKSTLWRIIIIAKAS